MIDRTANANFLAGGTDLVHGWESLITEGNMMTRYALEGSIRFMRARADDARAELDATTDPDMRRYLVARINQAECEAGAMQRSVDAWRVQAQLDAMGNQPGSGVPGEQAWFEVDRPRAKAIEADVTRAEASWGIGR